MELFGQVTKVGDLKTLPSSENSKYTEPLKILSLEVRWFAPRSSQGMTVPGVTGMGMELRNAHATNCDLKVGDWITAEVGFYPNMYTDNEGKNNCSTRVIINRYAKITDFEVLMS